jgi:tetratricopeptide (TPR) repeat protein/tRNA A-37 threonylcarbamoyl transferase component Bud32
MSRTDKLGGESSSYAPTLADGPEPEPGRADDGPDERELDQGAPVGRYVVLDRIGVGGMGIIYRAYDPQLSRPVAIKVVKVARASNLKNDPAGARLMREAQAMAQLSHPNVLAVYDVGELDGDVFIAMEYVQGQTLQQWLDDGPHEWREIVDFFAQAARGLAAAHAAALVHRDFKPDNVLIGQEGRARVLDFGLALASNEEIEPTEQLISDSGSSSGASPDESLDSLDGLRSRLTQYGMVMGTPDYMAPEQHMGNPPDHRCDQFSFCVSLYRALFRRKPFEGETAKALAKAKIKGRLIEPPRDSTPRWVRRLIRKGLSPRPADRWENMDALLAVIDRHTGRRGLRWFVAASVLGVAVAVTAGSLAARAPASDEICTGGVEEIEQVWNEERRGKIEQRFLTSQSPLAADAWANVETAIDDRARGWTEMHKRACMSTQAHKEQSTDMLDLQVACLSTRLRELDALLAVFEQADAQVVQRSPSAVRSLPSVAPCGDRAWLQAQVKPPDDPATAEQVQVLRQRLAQTSALSLSGQYDAGLDSAQQTSDSAMRLGYAPLVAEAALHVGDMRVGLAQYDAAERAFEDAYITATASGHDQVAAKAAVRLMQVTGVELARTADGDRWSRIAEASIDRLEASPVTKAQFEHNLGQFLELKGEYEEALAHLEIALEKFSEYVGEDSIRVARTLTALGSVELELDRTQEALDHFKRALEIRRLNYGPAHPQVARSLANLGAAYYHVRGYQAAIDHWTQSLDILDLTLGPDHPNTGMIRSNLGAALVRIGSYEEAEAHYQASLTIKEAALGGEHPELAPTLSNLGNLYGRQGRIDEAIALHARAAEITETTLGGEHPRLAEYLAAYGDALRQVGRRSEARPILERALTIARNGYGDAHIQTAVALHKLAQAEFESRELDSALKHAEESNLIMGDREDQEAASVRFTLARVVWEVGDDRDRAVDLALAAQELLAEAGLDAKSKHDQVSAWLLEHDEF